jgi:D-tyrosyl-tRNA(Tyr) deacylase
MNRSLLDVGGQVLSISQFTLYGDCRKGRRPNFMQAAKPEHAKPLYEQFNDALREKGIKVETGVFGAMMDVQLNNHGPVTVIIESKEKP